MDYAATITNWLRSDTIRWQALEVAASLQLTDWCLGAGFVRNLVWDHLHHKARPTPLRDIDVVYFNAETCDEAGDIAYQQALCVRAPLPWSVKNQARMHTRNNDRPYTSTADALRHWVEGETAVGVRLTSEGQIEFIAPFGLDPLFDLTITLNTYRNNMTAFEQRIHAKQWLTVWPQLQVKYSAPTPNTNPK